MERKHLIKAFYIRGCRYDTSNDIITTLMEVALDNAGTLTDQDFDQVVQEYEADEDRVMVDMACSKKPLFFRYPTGWDVKE